MVQPVLTRMQPRIPTDVVKWSLPDIMSNEQALLAAGQTVEIGTPLGQSKFGAPTVAAKVGNTGNGVLTADPTAPLQAGAQLGAYTAVCTAAAVHGGTFEVLDPEGAVIGNVAVGATFDDQLKFTIAAGATDFIVGDSFAVTVPPGSGIVGVLNPTSTDGSQSCIGVAIKWASTAAGSSALSPVLYKKRLAVLSSTGILWPDGFTAAQIAQATADMAKDSLIVRQGV